MVESETVARNKEASDVVSEFDSTMRPKDKISPTILTHEHWYKSFL